MFLANAAITSWIKFMEYLPPAVVVSVMQGLAILYLGLSYARWARHVLSSRAASQVRPLPAAVCPLLQCRAPLLARLPIQAWL